MLPDILANATLTPEQKKAIEELEAEKANAQTRVKSLETKIATLEQQIAHEQVVLTRPEFNREVARMLAFDERYGGISSVLYFDFAGLNAVAANLGASSMMEAVKTIVQMFARSVRRSDIVGRLAPDEFGVLLVRCNNENAWKKGRELAGQLAEALQAIDGKMTGVTVSFGAYTFREEEDVGSGIKQAAQALTHLDGPRA